jgi:DNA-binding NarL/FixJ family response regulator
MGDLLTLAAFSLFPPITNTLVGAFSTEREALAACKDKQPDLLYVTECLEQGYGIPLAVKVRTVSPNTRVLLFLHRENQEVVRDALDAHIDGIAFVSSIGQGFDGDFFKSLEAMANDSSYYPKVVRETAGFKKNLILNELSVRETEVLEALCQGMSNKEIAEVMFVSTETVKSHVSTVISKLGVKDRTQAVIACIRAGM